MLTTRSSIRKFMRKLWLNCRKYMRADFLKVVLEEMGRNKNLYFLTGDLGYNVLEPLAKNYPDRFLNVGVAEQNMIGAAAGLALTGKKVIVYSIVPFVTLRCYEQIRNDICYQNLDVKIVGTGGAFNYNAFGVTHSSYEDFAIMRAQPGMKIISPAYVWEMVGATKAMLAEEGPTYLRSGRNPVGPFADPKTPFKIGKGFEILPGKEVVILATGNALDTGLSARAELVKDKKLSVSLISIPTIKPLDEKLILEKAKKAKLVVTLEEHSVIGGLGGAVAELFADKGVKTKLLRLGFPDKFVKDVGSPLYLMDSIGLSAPKVAKKIREVS